MKKKAYTFTVKHKDGQEFTGCCVASSGWTADGYAHFAAMRNGWKQEDITVHVENADGPIGSVDTWLERKRYEGAYDASIGHDTDDEGFSYHDYS